MDLLLGDAFAKKVSLAALLGDEEKVRDGIGQHSIDLLGHRAIEAPESGFDMSNRNPQFGGCQSGSECRVDIADHKDRVWLDDLQDRLQASYDEQPGYHNRSHDEVANVFMRHLLFVCLGALPQNPSSRGRRARAQPKPMTLDQTGRFSLSPE